MECEDLIGYVMDIVDSRLIALPFKSMLISKYFTMLKSWISLRKKVFPRVGDSQNIKASENREQSYRGNTEPKTSPFRASFTHM